MVRVRVTVVVGGLSGELGRGRLRVEVGGVGVKVGNGDEGGSGSEGRGWHIEVCRCLLGLDLLQYKRCSLREKSYSVTCSVCGVAVNI